MTAIRLRIEFAFKHDKIRSRIHLPDFGQVYGAPGSRGKKDVMLFYRLDRRGPVGVGLWAAEKKGTNALGNKDLLITTTLEILREVEAALARQAASLLEEAAHVPAEASLLNESKLETTLREMAQFSQKISVLPDEAFTRESLYPDHD